MIDLEDEQDMLAQDAARRRYRQRLAEHPDPQDPDYPGDDDDN